MTFELFYALIGAPLLLLVGGLATVWLTRALERRERRLYDDEGWPRGAGRNGRPDGTR